MDGCGQVPRWGGKGFLGSFRIKQIWFLKEGVAVDRGDLRILALGILENHSLILLKKKNPLAEVTRRRDGGIMSEATSK